MAYIHVSSTRAVSAVIRYCEHEKADRQEGQSAGLRRGMLAAGVDCDPSRASADFKAVRKCWDKNNGVQAHMVIQSFAGTEVTPEQASQLGQVMAKRLAPGHQAVIITHTDTDNIHNHIIINSVRTADGHKFESSNSLWRARALGDEICKEHGLSIIEKPAKLRYTQSEVGLLKRGQQSWKDDIRNVIDDCVTKSNSMYEFRLRMVECGINVIEHSEKSKNRLTYQLIEQPAKKVRSTKLGAAYEWEGIQNELIKTRADSRGDRTDRVHADADDTRPARADSTAQAVNREIEQRKQESARISEERRRVAEQAERERVKKSRARERRAELVKSKSESQGYTR